MWQCGSTVLLQMYYCTTNHHSTLSPSLINAEIYKLFTEKTVTNLNTNRMVIESRTCTHTLPSYHCNHRNAAFELFSHVICNHNQTLPRSLHSPGNSPALDACLSLRYIFWFDDCMLASLIDFKYIFCNNKINKYKWVSIN